MTSATTVTGPRPPHAVGVRTAGAGDAAALHGLSQEFVREGSLRARPLESYAGHAGEFLVAESAAHGVEGCVGLRRHAASPAGGPVRPAVVYNFCVTRAGQGRGTGSALLAAVVDEARARGVTALFTATTGSGRLFLRHGFVLGGVQDAPAAWLAALDPRRGSRVLSLALRGPR
ncbi:GNAT family N-acetyltransferase [Streptomyces sp. C10-9-1]|uniref:GNAT family N-acetyltransferase n=1 Tax=Streptomyces sp. C10-9-1 TaxID=1859285 RepID=UPI003F49E6E5